MWIHGSEFRGIPLPLEMNWGYFEVILPDVWELFGSGSTKVAIICKYVDTLAININIDLWLFICHCIFCVWTWLYFPRMHLLKKCTHVPTFNSHISSFCRETLAHIDKRNRPAASVPSCSSLRQTWNRCHPQNVPGTGILTNFYPYVNSSPYISIHGNLGKKCQA